MRAVLVISDRDNVATALAPLEAGRHLEIRGRVVCVREPIPHGHKVALQPIAAGDAVIKYGSPIGLASADIAAGDHVHVHNVSSSRGRGDLGASSLPTAQPALPEPAPAASDGGPRLAEPPDDMIAAPGARP